MTSATKKKALDRLSVMVSKECKSDIDRIIAATGIKSNGELFRLLLARYREDFIAAYNDFFVPTTVTVQQQTTAQDTLQPLPQEPVVEAKPLTNAMSF